MKKHVFCSRYLRLSILCGDPPVVLNKLNNMDVKLKSVAACDEISVIVTIRYCDYARVKTMLDANGIRHILINEEGFSWKISRFITHPVLVAGMFLYVLLAVLLPGKILFIDVAGNQTVSDKQILEYARVCGVSFWCSARHIRSEQFKNKMLMQMPQLEWVGVNTKGLVATIHVDEREVNENKNVKPSGISSIVAMRDGIVSKIQVSAGSQYVRIGEKVNQGDLLISGYTNSDRVITGTNAKGEVYAYTNRDYVFVFPEPTYGKGPVCDQHECFSLKLGKLIINFCDHSRIPGAICDKMYSEKYWELPGGYVLPVSLIKQRYVVREKVINRASSTAQPEEWMSVCARQYTKSQMVAGEILNMNRRIEKKSDCCILLGSFSCNEMIGKTTCEEIIVDHAKDN